MFKTCVQVAKVKSIMCSYNAVNGVPSCANGRLQNDIVRGEWGWDGFIVSGANGRMSFCVENDESCIENDESCIENDESCIEIDESCISKIQIAVPSEMFRTRISTPALLRAPSQPH